MSNYREAAVDPFFAFILSGSLARCVPLKRLLQAAVYQSRFLPSFR